MSAKQRRAAAAADKAVIVLRVSTTKQGESGLGLEAQEAACRRFCMEEGLEVVGVFTDIGSGGKPLFDKANAPTRMVDALAVLKAQEAVALVAARSDRITRKNRDLYLLMDLSHRQGWCIRTADRRVDTCTKDGQMMAAVAGLFAEMEHGLISDRQRGAIAAKKARGVRYGASKIETPEPVRQRIRALRAEGLTMAAVADLLNSEGIKTARGKAWSVRGVQRVEIGLRLDDEAAQVSSTT